MKILRCIRYGYLVVFRRFRLYLILIISRIKRYITVYWLVLIERRHALLIKIPAVIDSVFLYRFGEPAYSFPCGKRQAVYLISAQRIICNSYAVGGFTCRYPCGKRLFAPPAVISFVTVTSAISAVALPISSAATSSGRADADKVMQRISAIRFLAFFL